MLIVEPRALIRKLGRTAKSCLEAAVALAVERGHYEVAVEHLLVTALRDSGSDLCAALSHFKVEPAGLLSAAERYVGELKRGNPGRPVLAQLLLEWLQDAWVVGSAELDATQLRTGALLLRLARSPSRYLGFSLAVFSEIPLDRLREELALATAGGREGAEAGADEAPAYTAQSAAVPQQAQGPLARFAEDMTAAAREGRIDPVVGRDAEVYELELMLLRRRKSNPVLVGEAGVGKTALVEGLALKIAAREVPKPLLSVRLLSLDLGALQAGASVKGEFEQRLKDVVAQAIASPDPVVMFIDEVHTLIGAGGQQGGDAANLLKPVLARGQLRVIGATTHAEYKRYIQKDAALERRFQPLTVSEPSVELAIRMLFGLAPRLGANHGVAIRESAVRAAVSLSARYIAGRLLPDKAVDVLDAAATRVRLLSSAQPGELDGVEADLAHHRRVLEALEADAASGLEVAPERLSETQSALALCKAKQASLAGRLATQRDLLERAGPMLRPGELQLASDDQLASDLQLASDNQREALAALRALPQEERLVAAEVDETIVARVIADWTGIPVGRMLKDDAQAVLSLERALSRRVLGQAQALSRIGSELRAARAGLKASSQPLGVFLLAGPSGVGKTETALALASELFGGERFSVTVNMSEFREAHSASRLIGSPPGYVGYGEGGVLTEAVRQRPYCVVLLDEVEKADLQVVNLFYQVFDKGVLADGEGRVVDFKNTLILLTTNLGADEIQATLELTTDASLETLTESVRPVLTQHFRPALLARMTVVPFQPMSLEVLRKIAIVKLRAIQERVRAAHGVELAVNDAVIEQVLDLCQLSQAGAREIERVLNAVVAPQVATQLLESLSEGRAPSDLIADIGKDGRIECRERLAAR